MSANINIRRDVSDKFYRYKMPKLISKIEGKGNGIKTVIPNMSEVARALSRPSTYTTKFFGCELGAQVNCDAKNDRYVVNGAHDAEKLQKLLDIFIEKFVLCASCKNPETVLVLTKDDFIMKDCKACGANLMADNRHKLVTYIIKNPPTNAKRSKKSKNGADGKKGMPTPPETASNGSDDEDADDVTAFMDAEAAAAAALPVSRDVDDDDWAVDTSEDAVAARMKELAVGGAVAKLTEADDDEDDQDDPLEQFAEYITTHPNASDSDLHTAATNLSIRPDKACAVLAQVLLTSAVLTNNEIPKRAPLIRTFSKTEKAQKNLLGGIERLVGVSHKELMPKIPMILKALYDEDLVDEEVFLAWGEKPSKKFVERKISKEIRERAAPFLAWLKEADEESEEEEESDEE
ncbi:domain found in IF2B/IF5-domain-containing protein [Fimicolochytrium jonesii]|uniref:domain found in IF2B/IF5-domain-containing protein n=1 Tax=Fimicolochytrium jonesii TaxID=1396493 RepID=UPI0022FED65D|nr:domain found in IF2B/IF5-domain-containing protein [Fimicolochytrium jonesii]KAI8815868.1 domain found in IF2B/IF5-domain-containing protein [Fimicolochytrium jonesii]